MLALAMALALLLPQHAAATRLPAHGVLVPGESLAGVHLGDSGTDVRRRWDATYRVCRECGPTTWYFSLRHAGQEPFGAGVTFRQGRVAAVYTLGSPPGWRTREGLVMGESLDRVVSLYGRLTWRLCVGYGALTIKGRNAVTAIYTTGESVYGFALARRAGSVCQ